MNNDTAEKIVEIIDLLRGIASSGDHRALLAGMLRDHGYDAYVPDDLIATTESQVKRCGTADMTASRIAAEITAELKKVKR